MSQIDRIRTAYRNGSTVAQICRDLGFDRKTVNKHLQEQDFTQPMPIKPNRLSLILI